MALQILISMMPRPSPFESRMVLPRLGLFLLLFSAAATGTLGEMSNQSSSRTMPLEASGTMPSSAVRATTASSETTATAPQPTPSATKAATPSSSADRSGLLTSAVFVSTPAQSSVAPSSAATSTALPAPSSTLPPRVVTTGPMTTSPPRPASSGFSPSTTPRVTSSLPAPVAPPASTSPANFSACVFENVESEFCVGSSINLVPSTPCLSSSKSVTVQLFVMDQASSTSPKLSSPCLQLAGSPSVSITRDSADIRKNLAFLFRDENSISEEGLYCAFLCTGGPSTCDSASAEANFGFVVTSAGCWNYAALIGSSVTLSLALLVTCIVAFVVWRRRRAHTSSGNRNRLPSISLPSLGRSRTPRFNRLVNEVELQNVHAEEHRFLMGSDGAGGSDALANDSSSSDFSGHTFVDIFGDTDQSSMSFVTNRPQVDSSAVKPGTKRHDARA